MFGDSPGLVHEEKESDPQPKGSVLAPQPKGDELLMAEHTTASPPCDPPSSHPAWWPALLSAVAAADRASFDAHPGAHTSTRPAVPAEWWPAGPLPNGALTIVTRTPAGLDRRLVLGDELVVGVWP